MSRIYSFKILQKIPAGLNDAWQFFSNPANLQEITPADLKFRIISKYHGPELYAGQLIEYTVRPLLGIPLYWMTEITHVQDKKYFIDEQRYGPYSFWHHQHHFREADGGTEMTDIVHYKLPFSILGDLANSITVKAQLQKIFHHRVAAVEKRFGKLGG